MEKEEFSGKRDDIVVAAETIEDVCTEMVASGIISAAVSNNEILATFDENKFNRSFNNADLMLLANITNGLTMEHVSNIENEDDNKDPTVKEHLKTLSRNLAGFHLEVDEIPKDGDCALSSIVRMLRGSLSNGHHPDLRKHLIGLGLLKTEKEDTRKLRECFVDEIVKEENELLAFFPSQDRNEITQTAKQFRRQGVFDTALGDFVIRVCAELLRVPIMVVTSLSSLPYVPFVPSNPLSRQFMYVAYHYYGAGHYDATRKKQIGIVHIKLAAHLQNISQSKLSHSGVTVIWVSRSFGHPRYP